LFYRSEYANRSVGAFIPSIRVKEVDGTIADLPGSHWGDGVVILMRDHIQLKQLLAELFALDPDPDNPEKRGFEFTNVYSHLLRAFCFGSTYGRLFAYGAYKGYRTHHVPFINSRFKAIEGKQKCYSEACVK
jgi:hypothetical protein